MLSLKTKISTPLWKEAAHFYQQLFGFQEVEAWDEPDDKGIILAVGEAPYAALLEIYASEEQAGLEALSLQIKVPDIEAFLKTVPESIPYEGPTARPWGARYAYFRDPAGTSVIVFDGPTY